MSLSSSSTAPPAPPASTDSAASAMEAAKAHQPALQGAGLPTPSQHTGSDLPPVVEDKIHRKRMRVPTSCSICRKRKIKCDKVRPICGGCRKSGVDHLCKFEDPSWVSAPANSTKKSIPLIQPPLSPHVHQSTSIPAFIQPRPVTQSQPQIPFQQLQQGPVVYDGLNLAELTPHARRVFEEMTARVKHLEASIAVHDLSTTASNNVNSASNSAQNMTPPFSENGFPILPPPSSFSANISPVNGTSKSPSYVAKEETDSPEYGFDASAKVQIFDYLPFLIKKNRLESHGPFSILSLMRKDPYLKVMWVHIWKTLDRSHAILTGQKSTGESDCEVEGACVQNVLTSEFLNRDSGQCGAYGLLHFLAVRKEKQRQKQEAKDLIYPHRTLEELVASVLPRPSIIFTLSLRFFKFMYPFMPFLDENGFFSELHSFVSKTFPDHNGSPEVKIESKYDLATLGLILIVLRLGYLTLTPEELKKNEYSMLVENPITFKFAAVAWKCLEHYKFLKKPYGLKVVQLALYLKLYQTHCPEDDDISDSCGASIMLGTLFSMAYAVGLNRDPEFLTRLTASSTSKTQSQIWKRIWYKLLELDSCQALATGSPLHCHDESTYDNPLPRISHDDDQVDTYVNNDIMFVYEKTKLYRKVVKACHNIKNPPSALELIRLIKELGNFAEFKLGTFKGILNDFSLPKYAMVTKISHLIEIRVFTLHLSVTLSSHFESSGDQKKAYECLNGCLKDTMKVCNSLMNVVYNERLYFGVGFTHYLKPMGCAVTGKSVLVILAVLIRVLHSQRRLSKCLAESEYASAADLNRLRLLKEFCTLAASNLERIQQLLYKISCENYNFTKICLALKLLQIQFMDPDFDFNAIAHRIISDSDTSHLTRIMAHDLSIDEIPKSNVFDLMLDSEIEFLMRSMKNDLVKVLQPVVPLYKNQFSPTAQQVDGRHTNVLHRTSSMLSTTTNTTNTSNHDIFNSYNPPIYQRTSSDGTPASSTQDSVETTGIEIKNINLDNIFGIGNTAPVTFPNQDSDVPTGDDQIPIDVSTLLTDEEYAGLFSIFDDYKGI